MTKLKQIYKTLVEISRMQQHHKMLFQDGVTGLERANAGISRNLIQGDIVEAVEKLTNFNLDWMEALRKEYQVRDYSNVYEKYRLV